MQLSFIAYIHLAWVALVLIACKPQVEIKDYRTRPDDYYKLITGDSPCRIGTYFSPETSPFSATAPFSLDEGNLNFVEAFRSSLPPGLRMEHSDTHEFDGIKHLDFEFFVGDNPVCDHYVRFHLSDHSRSTSGSPISDIEIRPSYLWPELDLNALSKSQKLSDLNPNHVDLVSSFQCLKAKSGELKPVTKVSLYINGRSYLGEVTGDQLTDLSEAFFNAEGTAKVYANNRSDETKTVKLKGLQDNIPYLCSNRITTSRESKNKMAYSDNQNFDFPTGSPQFGEVSAFANTADMMNWFSTLGFKNWSVAQVDIILDTPHSPQYLNPEFRTNLDIEVFRPTILLPDTLGDDLNNIHEDIDAVSHELSHHYLYKFWPTTSGTSYEHYLMHEGISDFFVAAKTKDSCIGNRICSEAFATGPSAVCMSKQCLRNTNNELSYKDDLYFEFEEGKYRAWTLIGRKPAIHKMSQVVSGMLWNLHINEALGLDAIANLVIYALPFTNRMVDIQNFTNALFQTSRSYFPQYECRLLAAAKSKGLDKVLKPEFRNCSH